MANHSQKYISAYSNIALSRMIAVYGIDRDIFQKKRRQFNFFYNKLEDSVEKIWLLETYNI